MIVDQPIPPGPPGSGHPIDPPQPPAPGPPRRTPGQVSPEPVTRLRGAAVEVDSRRAAQAIIAVLLATLAATASVLTVAGADRNAQIDQLRRSGVPVAITVTGCRGDLGGSGSNAAGYTCQGTFRLAGRSYPMSIPGLGHQVLGSKLRGVAVPSDPALVTTAGVLAGEPRLLAGLPRPGRRVGRAGAARLGPRPTAPAPAP